ncbi:MAG: serine hydroxymethyltransferase, partial [Cytophagales bacterium]
LEHVIAAKAVAYGEALSDSYLTYIKQVQKNAQAMAKALVKKDYQIISGGTDNHLMLIDLRNKDITGKEAENSLIEADITINKNMVPFDDKSPFVTSGMRLGTAAISTRGLMENDMEKIVEFIDRVLVSRNNPSELKSIKKEINDWMNSFPLFKA